MAQPHDTVAKVAKAVSDADRLAADAELARLRAENAALRGRYKASLAAIDAANSRADQLAGLKGVAGKAYRPAKKAGRQTSATAVAVLSDWHVEETITLEQTSGANQFSLEIAERRIAELAERLSTLIEHERRLVKIDRIVLALLGDFISGHIHEELMETTLGVAPMQAMRWAASRLRGIIDMAADMAKEVVVVTQPGNHGRSTVKVRMATEHRHSFEHNQYHMMRSNERRKNVHWQIAEGYLGYLDLDGFTIRYHHGHSIGRYQGGIGGITIPANKAIAAWNRSRHADLDLFGHWHQFGWLRGRYVSNGSLIGMSPFALRIRAEAEAPCQSLVIVDHGRNECTKAMPVWCDRDMRDLRRAP
jgi:hypothetical protein